MKFLAVTRSVFHFRAGMLLAASAFSWGQLSAQETKENENPEPEPAPLPGFDSAPQAKADDSAKAKPKPFDPFAEGAIQTASDAETKIANTKGPASARSSSSAIDVPELTRELRDSIVTITQQGRSGDHDDWGRLQDNGG